MIWKNTCKQHYYFLNVNITVAAENVILLPAIWDCWHMCDDLIGRTFQLQLLVQHEMMAEEFFLLEKAVYQDVFKDR